MMERQRRDYSPALSCTCRSVQIDMGDAAAPAAGDLTIRYTRSEVNVEEEHDLERMREIGGQSVPSGGKRPLTRVEKAGKD